MYNVFRAKADNPNAEPVMVRYRITKEEAESYCKMMNPSTLTPMPNGTNAIFSYWYEPCHLIQWLEALKYLHISAS
jgi:hypothetical protein